MAFEEICPQVQKFWHWDNPVCTLLLHQSAMKSPEPWSPSPGGNRGDSKKQRRGSLWPWTNTL